MMSRTRDMPVFTGLLSLKLAQNCAVFTFSLIQVISFQKFLNVTYVPWKTVGC